MIKNLFKKIFGESEEKESGGTKLAIALKEKSEKFSNFLSEQMEVAKKEFFTIKEKCKDLRQTNYNLGIFHLEKGNLSEAIFRFRLTKKFWPDHFDTYYQLAYCLTLKKKNEEAKKVLQELLEKKPDYDKKARELLEHLKNLDQTGSNV